MHISKLTLVNYRNFSNTSLKFNKGINTIIGENGSGKTNLFRAIRLLLDDNLVRSAFRIEENDFHRGLDDWRGHWIIISIEFHEIGPEEAIQALFLHGTGALGEEAIANATYNLIFRPKKEIRLRLASLPAGDMNGLLAIRQAITIADYETVFTGRSNADFNNPAVYQQLVGNFTNCVFSIDTEDPRIGSRVPVFLSVTKEVSFTFVQALRDVVAEFHNNRTNPLFALLKSKSGDITPATMASIVAQVRNLNSSIEALDDVQTIRADIRDTIKDTVGETYSPMTLSIKSDLSEEAEKLFQSLKLFVGESDENYEGGIHELSLGGANLIFLTLKLLEFKYQRAQQSIANFLLIEEPEAHIHTHIQKTLFDRIVYPNTQIIYSTHSTHISEVSNVQSVNILGRHENACEAYQPTTGLAPVDIGNIQRYLDAVRSNLLFAKSVMLVEGDTEEILIPILVKKVLGLSLDELGISLINIRSTGFKNVAVLFHATRIKKRCAIVTDLDTAFIDTNPLPTDSESLKKYKEKCFGSQLAGGRRKLELDTFIQNNQFITAHYALHTFEVDFIAAGNATAVSALIPKIYVDPSTITAARADISSDQKHVYGWRVLTMAANQGKGWFAIMLGENINHQTIIPAYIRDAIFFAQPRLTIELFYNIYSYRIKCAEDDGRIPSAVAEVARATLKQFRDRTINLTDLKTRMLPALPNDQIHTIVLNVQ